MKPNVGKIDSVVRVVVALVIFGAGLYFKSYWGLIGFVLLATAYFRRCPSYVPFKISTVEGEKK